MDNRYFGSCPPPVRAPGGRAAILVGTRPVGAPFPARATRRPPAVWASGVVAPVHLDPFTLWGWLSWVHYRIVGLRGRPSPAWGHARSRRARRCWVPLDWLWSRPSTPSPAPGRSRRDHPRGRAHAQVHDQRDRDTNCTGGPDSADHTPDSRVGHGVTMGPQPVAWHPNRGGLVENGRAPKPGTAARATT
jgi:hypothetical protein